MPFTAKTHCTRGHEFVEGSYKWRKERDGRLSKLCMACVRQREKERWQRNKAAGISPARAHREQVQAMIAEIDARWAERKKKAAGNGSN